LIQVGPVVEIKGLLIADPDEGYCAVSDDAIHCPHWWDGDGCCLCDAPPMTEEEKKEQGMK